MSIIFFIDLHYLSGNLKAKYSTYLLYCYMNCEKAASGLLYNSTFKNSDKNINLGYLGVAEEWILDPFGTMYSKFPKCLTKVQMQKRLLEKIGFPPEFIAQAYSYEWKSLFSNYSFEIVPNKSICVSGNIQPAASFSLPKKLVSFQTSVYTSGFMRFAFSSVVVNQNISSLRFVSCGK